MAVMVCAFNDDTPNRHATNAANERHPVAPHECSPPISATISTMRPSMALRCLANSANSSNNTSSRSLTVTTGVSNDADQDMTPYWHAGTTNFSGAEVGTSRGCVLHHRLGDRLAARRHDRQAIRPDLIAGAVVRIGHVESAR